MPTPEERIEQARRLLARGRTREALDALNRGIQAAPGFGPFFATRAEVFERMGLWPQAAADRERAAALGALEPEPPPEPLDATPAEPAPVTLPLTPEAPAAEVSADAPRDVVPEAGPVAAADEGPGPDEEPSPSVPVPDEAAAPAGPAAEWRPYWLEKKPRSPKAPSPAKRRAGVPGGSLPVLMVGGGLLFAVIGVVLLILQSGGGDGENAGGGAAVTVMPSAAATATATPAETGGAASTVGDPYSLSSLKNAWSARGMTVTLGGESRGFEGFERQPVDVTLERSGRTMSLAAFVYEGADATSRDWTLAAGEAPTPAAGRTLPSEGKRWYNANVVIVVLGDPGGLSADALDAFLSLTP